MSIIFEGVDGTGKTTDARRYLSVSPDYFYIHNWAKPKKAIDIASEIIKETLLLLSPNKILFDRSYVISEYIYAHILGRQTTVEKEVLLNHIQIINNNNHTLKLFIYDYITDLKFKEEDKGLPFKELNAAYKDLFINQFKINNLLIENISKRGKNENH